MNMDIIDAAGQILRQGGLVAFPTETVYGLGANALDEEAARKTYAAKGRPSDNPLIVHIADLKDLYPITKGVPEKAVALAEKFWPGPLTHQGGGRLRVRPKRQHLRKAKPHHGAACSGRPGWKD